MITVRIYDINKNGKQGGLVARYEAESWGKWPPAAAMARFVKEERPPAGNYLCVADDDKAVGAGRGSCRQVWSFENVTYPDAVISSGLNAPNRSQGIDLIFSGHPHV